MVTKHAEKTVQGIDGTSHTEHVESHVSIHDVAISTQGEFSRVESREPYCGKSHVGLSGQSDTGRGRSTASGKSSTCRHRSRGHPKASRDYDPTSVGRTGHPVREACRENICRSSQGPGINASNLESTCRVVSAWLRSFQMYCRQRQKLDPELDPQAFWLGSLCPLQQSTKPGSLASCWKWSPRQTWFHKPVSLICVCGIYYTDYLV